MWHVCHLPTLLPPRLQDVCLMGAPVETQPERWQMARRVVAGRLINCYSRRDWLLGVCYGGQVG